MEANCSQDILVWSCGTWCYRHESHEFGHLPDDYKIIRAASQAWNQFLSAITQH